jgi:Asp/Glu/hydantoin racemase
VSGNDKPGARVLKVLLVGPTSAPWSTIAEEIEADLARLARPGVELTYRCTGEGPLAVHSKEDSASAAPFVVKTIVAAAGEGFDAAIVDCTADPGVVAARKLVRIPVVGAGEALQSAISTAPRPVCRLTGDELRRGDVASLMNKLRGAASVALGGTGFSHLVEILTAVDPGLVVLDPLTVALDECVARLAKP